MSLKQRVYRVTMTVIVTENAPNSMLGVEMVAKYVEEAIQGWAETDSYKSVSIKAQNIDASYRWEGPAPGSTVVREAHDTDVMARLDYLTKCRDLAEAAKNRIIELLSTPNHTVDDAAAAFNEIKEQAAMAYSAMQRAADIVCAAAGRGKP